VAYRSEAAGSSQLAYPMACLAFLGGIPDRHRARWDSSGMRVPDAIPDARRLLLSASYFQRALSSSQVPDCKALSSCAARSNSHSWESLLGFVAVSAGTSGLSR